MTHDMVQALSDDELVQVIAWAQHEQKVREEKSKREAIAKIRELAAKANVRIKVNDLRKRKQKQK